MIEKHSTLISDSQLDKILHSINNTDGLSSGQVALLAALIGGLTAVIAQLISYYLNRKSETNKIKEELIAEERGICISLVELYKASSKTRVKASSWYRSHEIENGEKRDFYYSQGLIYHDRIDEYEEKIRMAKSEYFKIVTHFININKKNSKILELLNEIREFNVLAKSDGFENCNTHNEIFLAEDEECTRIFNLYNPLINILDEVYSEMRKN